MKLNNVQTSPKTYWPIIRSCFNGRKIPMNPTLSVNGKTVTNFKEKTNLCNKYFSCRCNPLPNDSKLPESETYITETKFSSFNIEDEDVCKMIKTLDIDKTHGQDELSIRILKLCDESTIKPLSIICRKRKLKRTFPNLWKKKQMLF